MEEKMTNIGGRLHDASMKHTVAGANEIMDDNLEKKQDVINAEQQETNTRQSVINQETDEHLGEHDIHLETHDTEIEDRYLKTEVYRKDETYNKTQINSLISPTDQPYENYSATDQTQSISEILPVSGNPGTIYRVGNWDGTHYNPLVFTEYGWEGAAYVPLATKNMEQSNIRMSNTIPGMLESVLSTEQPNVVLDDSTGAIKMVYDYN